MRLDTAEWIEKAEGDFRTAEREVNVQILPNFDAVCFHSQQCAEKFLKAAMVEHGIYFPKTHDLVALLELLIPAWPAASEVRAKLANLSSYSVHLRYPGDRADKSAADDAFADCEKIAGFFREHLKP